MPVLNKRKRAQTNAIGEGQGGEDGALKKHRLSILHLIFLSSVILLSLKSTKMIFNNIEKQHDSIYLSSHW